jgi:hypothetical protein
MNARILAPQIQSILIAGLISITAQGRVVDDFNDNTKTDWKDFSFGVGTSTEVNGQLKFEIPAAGQPLFAASTKTSETYTLQDGRTIELRVDMISGNGKDSFGILSWTPTAQSVSALAGYSIAKSSTDILITKGINKYFYNENPATPIKNENVTLVLSLTGRGASVVITAKVLDKDDNNAVLFERTFVDTPEADPLSDGTDSPATPYFGPGNLVLFEYEDFAAGGPDVYEVIFDNAQAFVLDRTVVDNFDDNLKTDWKDFSFGVGTSTETGGQFKFEIPAAGQPLFAASTKTSRTFDVVDGERIELRVDMISGNGKDSFGILSWTPTSQSVSALAGYAIAKSSTDILITKGINKYFYNEDPTPALKNENITLVLSLEGSGPNVIITGQVLDKDDNNAVLFSKTFIDTPAADIFSDGTDNPAAPYMGSGNFVLFEYEDFAAGGPDVYEVIFDNAEAFSAPPPANTPPVIGNVVPEEFANFVSPRSVISFQLTDDKALDDSRIAVTLNGERFTAPDPLTITGTGNVRLVVLSNLVANVNYVARLEAVDSDGATNQHVLYFDTFESTLLQIEAEDYNFNGGQFFDNPVPGPEGFGAVNSYVAQVGIAEIDFHDQRASANNYPYRIEDPVGTKRTLDFNRAKFTAAGGAEASVYDYDIGDIDPGEFLNYTRTFPAGVYEVYLRASLFNVPQAETVLEKVTGDTTQPDQSTTVLGSFLGFNSGSKFRNIPLTDGLGQTRIKVSLSGKETLRLRQVTGDPGDGNIYQNYLILVPAADTGPQRPGVASVSPVPGAVLDTVELTVAATLQNRGTSVATNSIVLRLNGAAVSPVISSNSAGIHVTYAVPVLPAPNAPNTAVLIFADGTGFLQTNEWSFTVNYKVLAAVNRRAGPGEQRGFNIRVVQAPSGSGLENNLARAEEQLKANSTIPAFYTITAVVDVINFTEKDLPSFDGYFEDAATIPGLQTFENGNDDIAAEIHAYLELEAGAHRFGVRSDDGFELESGASLNDPNALSLGFRNGGTADMTFDFVVTERGFYPFRMVWYERAGGAHAEWFSVNRATGERTLINDSSVPGAIKAFVSVAAPQLLVESAAAVTGPYTTEASAVVNSGARSISVDLPGSTRFYRLRSGSAQRITRIQIAGNKLSLTYE